MSHITNVSGYCPIQNCEYNVDCKYIKIPVLGSMHDDHKCQLYCCEYADENGCDLEKKCPIALNSP